jgi:hypothetical protein
MISDEARWLRPSKTKATLCYFEIYSHCRCVVFRLCLFPRLSVATSGRLENIATQEMG